MRIYTIHVLLLDTGQKNAKEGSPQFRFLSSQFPQVQPPPRAASRAGCQARPLSASGA